MLFRRFYDDDLAQASYFIGCQETGEAVVIDPRRDVRVYLDEAEAQGMTLRAVTETHIHADYLSGSRELAEATGATLYLSDEGGEAWQYGFPHEGLRRGDTVKVGTLTLQARHTPGHTPEHLSFLLTDGATTDAPGFYLTGDFVFVGDLGRPDLLGESGAGQDTREPMAQALFKSLQNEFVNLPDFVQVWPGHGAGSACGKSLGAVASTTVGYEKLVSWWAPFVERRDEGGFVKALLEGQPDAPVYFSRMKRLNRVGPPLLGARGESKELNPDGLSGVGDTLILIDTRVKDVHDKDAVKGALHLPSNKIVTYVSYVIDPEADKRDIVLFAQDKAQATSLRDRLSYVGLDNVVGFITDFGNLKRAPVKSVTPEALGELKDPFILDIRTKAEFDAGHLPNAHRIHGGRVMWNLDKLPKDRPLVTHCESGARNTVVASALRAAGFENVIELEGSYLGWKRAQERAGVSA